MNAALRSIVAAGLLLANHAAAALNANVPPEGLPSAATYSATLLPDRQGVVSWQTLARVEPIKQGTKMVPRFSKEILGLAGQKVRVQGFVLALNVEPEQKHFLLSAVPPHCPFCLPAGPDAIVEVFAEIPVRYGYEPIVLSGKLSVLTSDPTGVLYRLTEAEPTTSGK